MQGKRERAIGGAITALSAAVFVYVFMDQGEASTLSNYLIPALIGGLSFLIPFFFQKGKE